MTTESNIPIAARRARLRRRPTGLLARIFAAFPSYRGRIWHVDTTRETVNCSSCWDGGSRDYFWVGSLTTGTGRVAPAQSGFDPEVPGLDRVQLGGPDQVCVVEHSIFLGKDRGLTLHVHPDAIGGESGADRDPELLKMIDGRVQLYLPPSALVSPGTRP